MKILKGSNYFYELCVQIYWSDLLLFFQISNRAELQVKFSKGVIFSSIVSVQLFLVGVNVFESFLLRSVLFSIFVF